MMKKYLPTLLAVFGFMACDTKKAAMEATYESDSVTVLTIEHPTKYLLLPIQESAQEALVTLDTGSPSDVAMDIRLAVDSIDYFVPFSLPKEDIARLRIAKSDSSALCWNNMQLSDTFDTSKKDYYHALYHHTPPYGWMNDPNGMVYKDGEYHLYYQFNPYGSKWGNMHWGHSVSKDLIHWENLPPAIVRDTLGHIFSGSTVIDTRNVAGFGKDAIIAFYTSHKWLPDGTQWQAQSMAYSTDNGRTYTKYLDNPILTPFDSIRDFRDPKVFWYEPSQSWRMIVSADKEMRFYSSKNLKDWTYLSAFGRGYGAQPNQFECPDFFQLPLPDATGKYKWVMIVNINPGCVFGGSATEYFIGEFDGITFTPDTPPSTTRWLDYGKDHYAFVTFSNTGKRILGLPWVSNWQYANITPFQQSRGVNGLPRELSLFAKDNNLYVASSPAKEVKALRKNTTKIPSFTLSAESPHELKNIISDKDGAYELCFTLQPSTTTSRTTLELLNSKGEITTIYFDFKAGKLVMDRTQSGLVDFGENAVPHDIESHDNRKTASINYVNDFALATWAPLSLLSNNQEIEVRLFIDKSMLELFIDNGRIAMTNLVFPTSPYTTLRFSSTDGKVQITDFQLHQVGL